MARPGPESGTRSYRHGLTRLRWPILLIVVVLLWIAVLFVLIATGPRLSPEPAAAGLPARAHVPSYGSDGPAPAPYGRR